MKPTFKFFIVIMLFMTINATSMAQEQHFEFLAKDLSVRLTDENGEWQDWSPKIAIPYELKIEMNDKIITIFNEEKEVYTVSQSEKQTYEDYTLLSFAATDQDNISYILSFRIPKEGSYWVLFVIHEKNCIAYTIEPIVEKVQPIREVINIVEDDDEDVFADLEEEDDSDMQEDEEVYFIVDNEPQFPGGNLALRNYLAEHIQYPETAKEKGISGKVFVNFVINKNGEIENVKIARSVDPDLDKEAIRVVQSLPKFKPGMKNGKTVKVSYTIPISF
ncbi:MAG: energy transducer TonB [Salinivirgaceae bacterium]|nr:energy transducer TonB [Salinivirgaceae bacterium]